MRYKWIYIITLLAWPGNNILVAQKSVVDSLISVLKKNPDNKDKAKLYHKIVSSTWDFDFEQGLAYSQQELVLANKLNDAEAKTMALTDVGMYHYFVGNYKEAAQYYAKAIQASQGKNFGEFPAYTITRIGNLFRVQGQFDSAQVYYQKSIELLQGKTPGISLASVYFHKGWLHNDLSQFKVALQYLHKARSIRNKIADSLLLAECWRVIGTAHLGMTHLDSASYYLNRVLRLAKRYGDTELVILTNINLGDYHQAIAESVRAINSYQVALDSLAKHDFKRYRALALSQIGIVFDSRGDYLKAIDYYLNSLRLNEELNSRHEIARVHGYLGWAQHNLKNYEIALEQAELCLSGMRAVHDEAGQAFALNLKGNVYYQKSDYLLAELFYDSALQIRKSLDLNILTSNTFFNLARVYERLGDYDRALKLYQSDLATVERLGNPRIAGLCYNNMGWLFVLKKEFTKAETNLAKAQKISKRYGQPIDLRQNYLNFARLYKSLGRTAESNNYYEKYIKLNDSLQVEESALAAQQRDALYQLDMKNEEIEMLSARNNLKEQEIKNQQARIYLQNTVLGLAIVALVLVSFVSVLLYRSFRTKKRANEDLSKLNRAIHEQKEEIQAQAEELTEANQTIHAINLGLEESVEERTQQLKQAYAELDTFIYRSSHDLRRPLTTFMGLTEVARISVKDSNALELFYKVNDTALNLDRMLAKLQSVSVIASAESNSADVAIEQELDISLSHFQQEILERRIRVERRVSISKPFVSYPAIIRIIIDNLIENAIQFTTDNPVIAISVVQKHNNLIISVSDNGEGIPEEFRNRLYEMYFRASERSRGNGLGLFLVKKAVVRLKGDIQFAQNGNKGSVFTVSLPI